MTHEIQTAVIAGGSAVLGGLIAASSTYLGVAKQLKSQRQSERRRERLQIVAEFVEASTLYMDEYEYWIAGRDDLLTRGGPERLDAQRDKVDNLNTARRSAYARLALVCSEDFLSELSKRLREVQEEFESRMSAASQEQDPGKRYEAVRGSVKIYGDFIDEVLSRLRGELSE